MNHSEIKKGLIIFLFFNRLDFRTKSFFKRVFVDILPLGSTDCSGYGSKNPKCCGSNGPGSRS